MNLLKPIAFLLTIALLQACNTKLKYPYAIRDFRQTLQPALAEIVSKGIVGYGATYNFLDSNATDGELAKLSYSEHPVLRAAALRIMTKRPGIDNFKILMDRLDDTAVVAVDNGEFGIGYSKIADDLIDKTKWKTVADKNKTIEEVITKHNNLASAYYIIYRVEPKKQYYPLIKQMVNRERKFSETECALFALARFKKKEDVTFIKEFLLEQRHNWRMGLFSFRLMDEYPDSSYLEVLDYYSKKNLYRGISGWNDADRFIETLAGYKNEKSALILDRILNRKPFVKQSIDSSNLKLMLQDAIYDNKCAAYAKLRNQIKVYIPQLEEDRSVVPPTQQMIAIPETDRW